MNVITRNFFRLLRSGALNEYEPLEPMSAFKWDRLDQMVHAQHVSAAAQKGVRNHQYDEMMNIPERLIRAEVGDTNHNDVYQLSNRFLNHRLRRDKRQTSANACSRSSMISSICSMPMHRRSISALTPAVSSSLSLS